MCLGMEEGCAMRDHHRLKWVGVISWKTGGRGFSGQAEKAGGGVVEVVSLSVTAQSRCPKQESLPWKHTVAQTPVRSVISISLGMMRLYLNEPPSRFELLLTTLMPFSRNTAIQVKWRTCTCNPGSLISSTLKLYLPCSLSRQNHLF